MDASGAAGSGYAAVPVRRKSRKKTVDRKASKGRKIKYVTHPKMQNFMFPQVRISEILSVLGRRCFSAGFWNVRVASRGQSSRFYLHAVCDDVFAHRNEKLTCC